MSRKSIPVFNPAIVAPLWRCYAWRCPTCRAAAGQPCIRTRSVGVAHAARQDRYIRNQWDNHDQVRGELPAWLEPYRVRPTTSIQDEHPGVEVVTPPGSGMTRPPRSRPAGGGLWVVGCGAYADSGWAD